LKLDENLDVRLATLLADAGHDAATVRQEGLCGARDEQVFEAARTEDRALITLDLDFANPIRFPAAGSAGVIVIRTPRPLLSLIEATLRQALPRLSSEAVKGKLWIVEPGRIREYEAEEPGHR
jgi:predicted nuclease of predicted toxin-antitoxin system